MIPGRKSSIMKKKNIKIVIGAANFGNKYGINKKKLSIKKINQILNTASKYQINIIDTAQKYGNSENIIGNLRNLYDLKIITKLPSLKKKLNNAEIYNLIFKSYKNLKKKKIEYILFHDVKDFLKDKFHNPKILNRYKGTYFRKLGVSVYSPKEFLKCIKYKDLDCIQIPYNILDYRWNNMNLEKIKNEKNIEIHVRSIFLKGILPNRTELLPYWFKDKLKLKNKLKKLSKYNKLGVFDICVSYVFQQKWIDKIVIGFSKKKQIDEIHKILVRKEKIHLNNDYFKFLPKKILMPKYW